jgi:hypothetical protein
MTTQDQLWCVDCGYAMTGLPELRCPECGRAYTRKDLIANNDMARVEPRRVLLRFVIVPIIGCAISLVATMFFFAGSWSALPVALFAMGGSLLATAFAANFAAPSLARHAMSPGSAGIGVKPSKMRIVVYWLVLTAVTSAALYFVYFVIWSSLPVPDSP